MHIKQEGNMSDGKEPGFPEGEDMRQTLFDKVCGTFEVRNSKRQKSAFLRWVQEMLREEGIPSRVSIDRCVVKNRNLIIGNLEKAATVVTAHYDTPKVMPFPFATYLDHFWLSLFSQSWGIILALAIPQFLLAYLSVSLFPRYLLFLLTFVLFFFTVNNRHNQNDNSSGVLGVLECALRCKEAGREDIAFVLFDNEEWGLLGSAGFAKKYRKQMKGKWVVNLDCIGAGDDLILVCNKFTLPKAQSMVWALGKEPPGKRVYARLSKNMLVMSDNANFSANGIMIGAFRKDRFGLKLSRIHRWTDRELDEKNIDLVCDLITAHESGKSVKYMEREPKRKIC